MDYYPFLGKDQEIPKNLSIPCQKQAVDESEVEEYRWRRQAGIYRMDDELNKLGALMAGIFATFFRRLTVPSQVLR